MVIRPILLLAMAALLTAAGPTYAAVFKCVLPSGKVEYRDYPCEGGPAASTAVDARPNSIGTGDDLESIRARDASMARRMDARRAADERAAERDRYARERAFYEERASRERQAIADAVRDNNSWGGGSYWPGYIVPPKHRGERPPPTRIPPPAIVTKRKD